MGQLTRKSAPGGFTLIEAMISMFFISFIVVEVALVSTLATRSTSYSQRLSQANKIAETLIEKCRNKPFLGLDEPFSAANSPADSLEVLEAAGNNVTVNKQYNETCTPAGVLALGGTRTCTVNPAPFTAVRTVSYWSYDGAVPPAKVAALSSVAVWADISVTVSWLDSRRATNQVQLTTRISAR